MDVGEGDQSIGRVVRLANDGATVPTMNSLPISGMGSLLIVSGLFGMGVVFGECVGWVG